MRKQDSPLLLTAAALDQDWFITFAFVTLWLASGGCRVQKIINKYRAPSKKRYRVAENVATNNMNNKRYYIHLMIQLQFPLHTSCNIDKSGKVWTPETKPQILIRNPSTLCQPEWITCSYWSIIAKIRVINCWPPIGYSPHGVPPSILLVHSSFSPNYKSIDPLY